MQNLVKRTELQIFYAGVQGINASYSDHLLNGIRKSVYNNTISNEAVNIHFFSMNEENLSQNNFVVILSPPIAVAAAL